MAGCKQISKRKVVVGGDTRKIEIFPEKTVCFLCVLSGPDIRGR